MLAPSVKCHPGDDTQGPPHTRGTGRGTACPVQGPGERWPTIVRPGSRLATPSPAMTRVAVPGPSARGPAWRPRVPTALVGCPAPSLLLSRPTHDSCPGYGLMARRGSRAAPRSAHPLSRPLRPLPPVPTCLPVFLALGRPLVLWAKPPVPWTPGALGSDCCGGPSGGDPLRPCLVPRGRARSAHVRDGPLLLGSSDGRPEGQQGAAAGTQA